MHVSGICSLIFCGENPLEILCNSPLVNQFTRNLKTISDKKTLKTILLREKRPKSHLLLARRESVTAVQIQFFTSLGEKCKKKSIQSPTCLCSTVTKPVCGDQSAVSSPRASCPARQRRPLLSQREGGGGGIYSSMRAGVAAPSSASLPQPSRKPPFKGVPQEPLCQQAAKYINIRTPFLTHRPNIHVSITRLQSCLCSNMLRSKQLSITFLSSSICERACRYSYKLTGHISPAADSARWTHFT